LALNYYSNATVTCSDNKLIRLIRFIS